MESLIKKRSLLDQTQSVALFSDLRKDSAAADRRETEPRFGRFRA